MVVAFPPQLSGRRMAPVAGVCHSWTWVNKEDARSLVDPGAIHAHSVARKCVGKTLSREVQVQVVIMPHNLLQTLT